MKNISELKIKIKRFLKKTGYGNYLHHFGPKTYEFVDHLIALLLLQSLRASLRRVEKLSIFFGNKCPSYSALCKSRKRIPTKIWNCLLRETANFEIFSVAVDSKGFSRNNPSFHYLKRINSKKPVKRYAKLSAFFDFPSRKFVALKVRVKPRHDIKSSGEIRLL